MASTIPTKKFLQWLKSKGLVCTKVSGSHQKWDYPVNKLDRPVVVKTNIKDLPRDHITTNLNTLKISKNQFKKEIAQL